MPHGQVRRERLLRLRGRLDAVRRWGGVCEGGDGEARGLEGGEDCWAEVAGALGVFC